MAYSASFSFGRTLFGRRFFALEGEEDLAETPAEVNARQNRARLDRINNIGNTADSMRAHELADTDGTNVTGRFQEGAFDETELARERTAQRQEEETRQAQEEQEERDREADRLEQEEADRLQAEGSNTPSRSGENARQDTQQDPDEKLVDGVRYYRTMVSGQERWLTLKELREGVGRGLTTEETLQRAQEALRSASHTPERPKPPEVQIPDERELANIVLAANMGDEEAVQKLVSVIRSPRGGLSEADLDKMVDSRVSQRIATQREVERAESSVKDLLGNEVLAPEFKRRLAVYAQGRPTDLISDAYRAVGQAMRKDFAAMFPAPGTNAPPADKEHRKRQIVTPPRGAGRQPQRPSDDREVPVSEQIDQMARARGQVRAHRIRRS